jgi:hypothetical protein
MSFQKLKQDHQRTPIRAEIKYIKDVNGVLVLDGERTEVSLSSSQDLFFQHDENGWFDLQLYDDKGQAILLKNSICTRAGTSYNFGNNVVHQARVYPNIIVFRSNTLASSGLISTISFSFPSLKEFLRYDFFENIDFKSASDEEVNVIKKRRKKRASAGSRPIEIFIVHAVPKHLIKFKVGDDTYSLHCGINSFAPPMTSIEVEVNYYASINFHVPIEIDEAIERVWIWKRFFEQNALKNFNIDSISVRSKGKPKHYWAPLYLPNVSNEVTKLHPAEVLLNRWKDRTNLSHAMEEWLSQEDKRKFFRLMTSYVIEHSRKRVSIDDILLLCSAIESLDELKEDSKHSTDDVDALAQGAHHVAIQNNIDINLGRIKTLLSMMRQQSLQEKIHLLTSKLHPWLSKSDAKLLIKIINKLRNASAHGGALSYISSPLVAPTVEALMSCCVLYDLTTTSMSFEADGNSHSALRSVKHALEELRHLTTSSQLT